VWAQMKSEVANKTGTFAMVGTKTLANKEID
jgi:hypothetical protein